MTPYRHKVQYYESDQMGIVHHSNYVRWMEEARVHFLEEIDWGYEKLETYGIVSPVTTITCSYKISTRFPEWITVYVHVEEFKGVRLKLKYEMFNEKNEMVFEGRSEHCFTNEKGQIVRLKNQFPALHELLSSLADKENA